MRQIAVVGAGFSGTLLALHLLRRCSRTTRVVLIERHAHFGRGPAYATENPRHLLNVQAKRMSAFGDRPLDFLSWWRRQIAAGDGEMPAGDSFASRQLFGAYMRGLLNDELREDADRLELVRANVSHVTASGTGVRLSLDHRREIEADAVVLAIGNFPPEPPKIADPDFYDGPFYRADPWRADALAGLDPDAPVLLIGTGLTMVDVVVSLLDAGHRGRIHAVSRRGLVPHRHPEGPVTPAPPVGAIPTSPAALLRLVRTNVARHAANGGEWHAVVDQLRPYTHDIWQAMSLPDRARFIRHLRPWWDIHRHRTARPVADRIAAARASSQLLVTAGRIRNFVACDGGVAMSYLPRQGSAPGLIRAARVINCSGPACDYGRIDDELVVNLLQDGSVRPDPLRLGLDVTASGALLGRDGAIATNLFAVGPVTRSMFWEMTAVPNIRRQCERLAAHLSELPCITGA